MLVVKFDFVLSFLMGKWRWQVVAGGGILYLVFLM